MLANIPWADIVGYIGALFTLGVYCMKRMIPLRIIGLCANATMIAYSLFAAVYPQLILHVVLLPINAIRLREMLVLVKKVKAASQGDLNMNWLKPHMSRRRVKHGEIIFRKNDPSSAMFFTATGRFRLAEIGQEIGPGQLIGELGLIAPENKRTLTFECIEDGELLEISYERVKELYYQNPEFGFYFLELTSKRLFRDIERLGSKTVDA